MTNSTGPIIRARILPGLVGPVNTLTVGTVTTGAQGSDASVIISGEAPNQTIDFTIPRGTDGAGNVSALANFSNDNRVIRSDGTTTNLQASGVTLDDSANMSGIAAASVTTIELGHASDTTLSRSAAGVVAVEGNQLLMAGRRTIPFSANGMVPRVTNGPSTGVLEMTTNKNMVITIDFDTTTQEFAQFWWFPPKSWNEGTVTFQPIWSHPSTTVNFGVVWALQGVAISDDDTLDVAFGTEQTSTDTGGTTNDLYVGPESSAITIGGTPADGDVVLFQIKRNPSDGADTLAVDARLHGVKIHITLNAATDA